MKEGELSTEKLVAKNVLSTIHFTRAKHEQ